MLIDFEPKVDIICGLYGAKQALLVEALGFRSLFVDLESQVCRSLNCIAVMSSPHMPQWGARTPKTPTSLRFII